MKIDWRATQKEIGAAVDGDPGRETWGKLFAYAAGGRPFNDTFKRLGESAAKHFGAYQVEGSRERIAGVIAETCHESAHFTRFEENLNYSAQSLANTWPSRYAVNPRAVTKTPNATAKALARRPRDIAIATYGMRMGNQAAAQDNDTHPDGWQYRGRGMLMLTGKANYAEMGKALGLDLIGFPELAADPSISLLIALEFMRRKGTFRHMDSGNTRAERESINGGLIGFSDVEAIRKRLYGAVKLTA